ESTASGCPAQPFLLARLIFADEDDEAHALTDGSRDRFIQSHAATFLDRADYLDRFHSHLVL
ncbi:MAG: hypothetical protein HY655_12795, partial [Acidobacteria bacterium]|nr:hypothetical protein [Acidobacteriota bacterium]